MKKSNKETLSKEERRWYRLEKGRRWLVKDNNLNKTHLVSRYRKYMRIDLTTAEKDLETLGARYNGGDEQTFRIHQESLQNTLRMEPYSMYIEDSNDDFSYIAGYTSGEVPFGVTWEDVGIDSHLPYEEKVIQYAAQMNRNSEDTDNDLPF